MTTDWLCAILIILFLIIGWIWTIKTENNFYYKVMIMYILSIIGVSIIGSIFY